jgi:1-aminocyclopropane-1-carboxylate deaminase/D-cysteine desulfhydrase-like pyridoxal-dependent ACC family enzyme
LATLGFDVELTPADVESYDEYVGEGYGAATDASLSAMHLAARTEGLLLDPVYTGKAMAGLIDQARRGVVGRQSTVVFIHTGGLPAMFAFKDEIISWLDRQPE